MNFSTRISSSNAEVLRSSVETIKVTNQYRRIIKQTWKEVEQVSKKYCTVVPLPPIVKQLNIKGDDLRNPGFISKQSKDPDKFEKFNKDMAAQDKEAIQSKVIDLQFHVDKDTFIECEHIMEIMRNAPSSGEGFGPSAGESFPSFGNSSSTPSIPSSPTPPPADGNF